MCVSSGNNILDDQGEAKKVGWGYPEGGDMIEGIVLGVLIGAVGAVALMIFAESSL